MKSREIRSRQDRGANSEASQLAGVAVSATTNNCTHATTRDSDPHCYDTCLDPWNCEPRAHGGCTYTEECIECGAQRDVNANCWYSEITEWGPSAQTRRETHRRAAAQLERSLETLRAHIPTPITMRSGGRQLTLTIDDEGYLIATGDPHSRADVDCAAITAPDFLAAAQALRRLHRKYENEIRQAVQS